LFGRRLAYWSDFHGAEFIPLVIDELNIFTWIYHHPHTIDSDGSLSYSGGKNQFMLLARKKDFSLLLWCDSSMKGENHKFAWI